MPKPKKGPRLGGSPAHQRLILSNLATALFEHGRITTTETRARRLRPFAERLIKQRVATVDDLLSVLRRNGVTAGADLARLLAVSPSTLHRLVRGAGAAVRRIGRTRGARYGALARWPAVPPELPVWWIDAAGGATRLGTLYAFHGEQFWMAFAHSGGDLIFDGMPPFLADMAPQGFLGRFFSERYPELDLPPHAADWSTSHIIQAIARRGEDAAGNLVVGEESMDRFLDSEPTITPRADYPAVTLDLARHGAGSSAALLGEPVKPGANGKVSMYRPEGSMKDPKSKISPFKYHTGRLPVEAASGLMVPVQVGPTFRTGNTMASALGGAKGFRGKELTAQDISYVEVDRWMGVFHEVVPKAQALKCADCHGASGNRLDWKALGYRDDPMVAVARRTK